MTAPAKFSMTINDSLINVVKMNGHDYICLTDMAKSAGSDRALHSWLRTKNTIDFLGFWEQINNPDFKVHEFVYFKNNAGANSFNPSVSDWISATRAVGIATKLGRYGGTYAHRDIAFEFGTWLSPEFKLLIITEFQRLKQNEQNLIVWDSHRYLSRINYRLHTDSIKNYLLPTLVETLTKQTYVYTDEADMLNKIVFGQTAFEWKKLNPDLVKSNKNQRDYATVQQLVLLANLQNLNAHFVTEGKSQIERIRSLAEAAGRHYKMFTDQEDEQRRLNSESKNHDK
jgi:KilA-N domain